jgi:tetratricopeptide (TPR) repeat protein
VNLGNILADRGRLDDAADHYRKALQLDSSNDNVYVNLAKIRRSLYELEISLGAFMEIRRNPVLPTAGLSISTFLLHPRRIIEGVIFCDPILSLLVNR